MGLNSRIEDGGSTGKFAEVDSSSGERQGLVVATRDLKTYSNVVKFFTNPTHGPSLNQNVTFGGTPIGVHNGTDNAYWTGSAISGTWDFASTSQAHAGTKSIDATATLNNSIASIAKGSDQSLTGYTAVTGWIYISAWDDRGTKQILFYGYRGAAQVGTSVNLANYANIGTLGSWQQFALPLTDMSLTDATVDSFRVQTVDLGAGSPPDYYLDDLQIEETGAPLEYTVEPDEGTWLHVSNMTISIGDALAGTLADATMPALAYNKILNDSALTIGVVYQKVIDGSVVESFTIRQLSDILQFPGTELASMVSDGTNTFITVKTLYTLPDILKPEDGDKLKVTVSDNLSTLLWFRISVGCKEEDRS